MATEQRPTTSSMLLPACLTQEKYKNALAYAKLASKTYDWDDNQVVKVGLAFFSGIDDIKNQDFTTPNYRRKGSGGNFVDFIIGQDDTGLDYTIYEHRQTGDVVLAFRGTEPLSIEDWKNDIQQVLVGSKDGQYEAAIKLAKALYEKVVTTNKKNLSFTGHSLGGGLATAAALATGGEAIVFCAAGLSTKTINDLGLTTTDAENNNNITNFNVRECFVSDWNNQMDDTTLGHDILFGLDSKQYGNIYWLNSVSDRADFIFIPDWLPVVKMAKKLLNHAWHVFTYQLEHKNFVITSNNSNKRLSSSSMTFGTPPTKRARTTTTTTTEKPIITPGEMKGGNHFKSE